MDWHTLRILIHYDQAFYNEKLNRWHIRKCEAKCWSTNRKILGEHGWILMFNEILEDANAVENQKIHATLNNQVRKLSPTSQPFSSYAKVSQMKGWGVQQLRFSLKTQQWKARILTAMIKTAEWWMWVNGLTETQICECGKSVRLFQKPDL